MDISVPRVPCVGPACGRSVVRCIWEHYLIEASWPFQSPTYGRSGGGASVVWVVFREPGVSDAPVTAVRSCEASERDRLLPDQLVLLLEHLLEQKTVTPRTLQSLERTYHLSEQDAEVRHRWCELIVKHKYTKAYRDVERFLQEDQAMGIYLYGELMLSEDPRQQHLARRCFELSREQMDRSSAAVVAEMLF
uniref:Uncharacterized protein n=1 Tax=Ovis aries TaxID=9940 RepID=A0AC11DZ60_SHEEP